MKETKILMKEVEVTTHFCDMCNVPKISKNKCCICSIDICQSHTYKDYEEYDYDYGGDKYCLNCWDIVKPYKDRIKAIDAVAEINIELICKELEDRIKEIKENSNEK